MNLWQTLPELALDVEGALVRLGRGKVADQLRVATLADWTYDDFARSTYLRMAPARDASAVTETIALFDDIGVNVDLDASGSLVGLDVSGYEHVLARLEKR